MAKKKLSGPSREAIVRFMADGTYRPLKPKELARALAVSQAQYGEFRTLLRTMLKAGEVIRLRRGRLRRRWFLAASRGRDTCKHGDDRSGGQPRAHCRHGTFQTYCGPGGA